MKLFHLGTPNPRDAESGCGSGAGAEGLVQFNVVGRCSVQNKAIPATPAYVRLVPKL